MLENAKAGDRVRSILAGWGTVVDNYHLGPFPIKVRFDCGEVNVFLPDGRALSWHENPEIVEVAKREWEPEGGEFVIDGTGSVAGGRTSIPSELYRLEGRAYPIEELANKAYAMIRPFQRLVAYVLEHTPDYEPDWEDYLKKKWYVGYDHRGGKYRADCCVEWQPLIQVFMPKEVAVDLAKKLNSGEVKL